MAKNNKRNGFVRFIIVLLLIVPASACARVKPKPDNPPIPIQFNLTQAGYVSLVIEKPNGVRVRNLVSDTWFAAGKNVVYWDGLDDLGQDPDAANHGLYKIPAHFVDPGEYRIRGLFHNAIVPHYQFAVYSPGNPPWGTYNHIGGWLANHTPPQSALYIPANQSPTGQPAVYLGCYVTEGLDGLAWVDLTGRKLGGKKWLGGAWTTAPFMARDAGQNANPSIFAYAVSSWETGKNSGVNEIRITGLNKGADKSILRYTLDSTIKVDKQSEVGGIAVNNNIAVVSLVKRNQLIFVDVTGGKIIGNTSVDSPTGVMFDGKSRLLVLSANKLLRYTIHSFDHLPAPEQIINSGLDSPYGLTVDAQGNIYVSDDGNTNQVKVFGSDGKFLSAIGKSGPLQVGLYDPLHMNNPAGITIDSKNQLWVAENDHFPKRVSIWTLDGKLIKAFYGPAKYGGGGTLDSKDKNIFFYSEAGGSMEFKLDWQHGTNTLRRVYYRPLPNDLQMTNRSSGPETPLYYNNKRYFTNCFNSEPTSGPSTAFLFMDLNNIAVPVAAAGVASSWNVLLDPKFSSSWPTGVHIGSTRPEDLCFFIWTDNNADGQAQPNEVSIIKSLAHGVTIAPDLSICLAGLGDNAVSFTPIIVTPKGIPQYDINKFKVLGNGVLQKASTGGDQVLIGTNGLSVVTNGVKAYGKLAISGFKNGTEIWTYPDLWPGLHASHSAPVASQPGELIGTTRLLGGLFNIKGSDIGQCWAINGNEGNVYFFTLDGLFITTVFQDSRRGKPWSMPVATRGMKLDSLTLFEENFFPTITQTSNDSVYMVDGDRSALISLEGLESIHRLPDFTITVSKNDLSKANNYFTQNEAERQQTVSLNPLTVPLTNAGVVVDGNLDDWAGADWASIDKSGTKGYFNTSSKPYNITGAVKISGGNLYAAYQTGVVKLANSGEAPTAPFITGQALDLMIGTDPSARPNRQNPVEGDLRLVVTNINNKPFAMLYRAVVKGTLPNNKVPFSSPSRTITFDKVEDVTSQIQFATSNGNYEISIPLSLIGLKPKDGMVINGDIGFLQGTSGTTTSRSYWSNKSAGINADLPSEAELAPALWGTWKIQTQ